MTENAANGRPAHIWNGLFATWEQCCAAAPGRNTAFLGDRWMNRIIQLLQEYRDSQSGHGQALPPRPCNLPLVCAITNPLTIVDFGGSSGWTYEYLKNTLHCNSISSYLIVEMDRIVEYMGKSGLHRPPVAYATMAELPEACDLLYCNSVLQYFGSNAELLELINRVKPKHILLDDLLAKGQTDFFSTQAYYGTDIPHRFIGMGQLVTNLRSAGYRLTFSAPFASPVLGRIGPLPMDNFPEEFRLRYSLTALFEKGQGG